MAFDLATTTPGVLHLHKGQRMVHTDRHRFRVVVAGRRWGKTQTAKAAIVAEATKPRRKIWYVMPTYRMARSVMWEELKSAFPRQLIRKVNETLMEIHLVNGTVIELKGADKPDTLRGIGLHLVVLDEVQDMKYDTWNKVLRPTLSTVVPCAQDLSTKGRALFIGTPKAYNWLYEIYQRGQRGEVYKDKKGKLVKNDWKSWQVPTIESPFIPRSEIESAMQDLDERSFRQEYLASFEAMSGRVYYAFDRKIHTGDYPFNPKLPIWIGQDFNIDPMSTVVMQRQISGEVWVVDELVMRSSNTLEVAEELGRRYYKYMGAPRHITLYPDPAGANRSHGRGESDLDILKDAGFKFMKYRKKHPAVADRVNAVNRMFKSAAGQIQCRINRDCKEIIDSLEQTIYKEGTNQVDKTLGTEHSADAMGYCVDIEYPVRKILIAGVSL